MKMILELSFQFHLAPGLLLHNCTMLGCRLMLWGTPVGARESRRQHLESCTNLGMLLSSLAV